MIGCWVAVRSIKQPATFHLECSIGIGSGRNEGGGGGQGGGGGLTPPNVQESVQILEI